MYKVEYCKQHLYCTLVQSLCLFVALQRISLIDQVFPRPYYCYTQLKSL